MDAGGSQLIVGARISNCASDRNELVADIEAIAAGLGRPETVLADAGYASGAEVAALEASGIEALVATAAEGRRRRHDFRPAGAGAAVKEAKADWLREMATKLDSEEGRELYRLRQQTVEPVFGVIKAVHRTTAETGPPCASAWIFRNPRRHTNPQVCPGPRVIIERC